MLRRGDMANLLRTAASALLGRSELADRAGLSFGDRRDVYASLGYLEVLKPRDYRGLYERGGIAKRLVEAFPVSTWRGGGELVEDEDPTVETAFEIAFNELNQRLSIWGTFQRADILAGLGRFSILLLGAPGAFDTPLDRCRPDELKYLATYSERDVTIESVEADPHSERFGLPLFYSLVRVNSAAQREQKMPANRIHYSRVIHIAEGMLDDPMLGTPRLKAVWNYLDDLMKVVGGGSEAFWKRADRGLHVKLDPTLTPTDAELTELSDRVEEYTHDLKRVIRTRGVELESLGSDVANFGPSAATILDLISATSGIPQRILMGSERGQLASSSDQSNYDDRVQDRRTDFAGPQVVRPFVDRLIALGVLPEPDQYEVRWPEIDDMDDMQRMEIASKAADVNQKMGETVISGDEIRDRYLGLPPLEDTLAEDDELEEDEPEEDDEDA